MATTDGEVANSIASISDWDILAADTCTGVQGRRHWHNEVGEKNLPLRTLLLMPEHQQARGEQPLKKSLYWKEQHQTPPVTT